MACSFCGRMYRDVQCATACSGCVLAAGCGRSKCPYCGYENQRPFSRKAPFWKRIFEAARGNYDPRK
jgi:hypothetical protein